MSESLKKQLHNFEIDGTILSIDEHKRGHINTTWIGTWETSRGTVRFVHQKVNHHVFKDVAGLMNNMLGVTERLREKQRATNSRDVTLRIIRARNGALFIRDEAGDYWRTFDYIENTTSYDVCPGPHVAREAAGILGRFHSELIDIDTSGLIETIPGFHNAPLRFDALERIVSEDPLNRVATCRDEVDFGLGARDVAGCLIGALEDGASRLRVTHNDMKLNNVLFDEAGECAIALVDLDTCMPGSVLFDFGDFARNTSVPAAEDETDHSKIKVDLDLFEAITQGYLQAVGNTLTERELHLLVVAPRVLALTLGTRFLTDYLQGDTYFKIHRPSQNLDRARAQFQVAERFRELESELREVVRRCRGSAPNQP